MTIDFIRTENKRGEKIESRLKKLKRLNNQDEEILKEEEDKQKLTSFLLKDK